MSRLIDSPEAVDPLHNLGVALAKKARLKSGQEQVELFSKVFVTYEKALNNANTHNNHEIYFDWGNALYRQATSLMNASHKDAAAVATIATQSDLFVKLLEATKKFESAFQAKPGLFSIIFTVLIFFKTLWKRLLIGELSLNGCVCCREIKKWIHCL